MHVSLPETEEFLQADLTCNPVKDLLDAERSKDRGERNQMTSPSAKTGAQVVADSLERQGVRHVFGIPGAKIDKVFDTLAWSSIQTVVCRHEQNASFIVGGIGRLTGRAGLAIATSGPGVSNLTTGL
jgi:hypothetical protein